MDENDYKYAEFIFQLMKQKPRNLASTVAEFTNMSHKGQPVKELLNFDHIFKYLEKIDLIIVRYNSDGRGRPQFLELSETGGAMESVQERIQQIKFDNHNQKKKIEREEEFIRDQSEYYKRQIWLSKYWYLTAIVTAFIGILIQKLFEVI
jgi:hypothetical protein